MIAKYYYMQAARVPKSKKCSNLDAATGKPFQAMFRKWMWRIEHAPTAPLPLYQAMATAIGARTDSRIFPVQIPLSCCTVS